MRLLLVTHYFGEHRSGIEILAREIAVRLSGRGHRIVWAASGPARERPVDGVRLVPMTAWNVTEDRLGVPYPLWGPASLLKLVGEVRRADVVHVHDSLYAGNVVAALVSRLLKKPLLVTQHVGLIPYASRLLRGLMSLANRTVGRLVLGSATRCVFYSEAVQRYFSAFVSFAREPAFIPNGIAFDRFRPLPEGERRALRTSLGWDVPVVLFVGRFVEKKGLAHVRRLAERIDGCRFVLIGWGRESPEAWGLPRVHCLGSLPQDEIVPYYQAADLLLLPSVGEGFPVVVQEAMACGTPALISEDTAQAFAPIREAAFVCELDGGALEERLRSLLASPEVLRARRPVAADFSRTHWSWDHALDDYEGLLWELVPPAPCPPTRKAGRARYPKKR